MASSPTMSPARTVLTTASVPLMGTIQSKAPETTKNMESPFAPIVMILSHGWTTRDLIARMTSAISSLPRDRKKRLLDR
eukprot:3397120-Pyramimonas_sp.AAC.1